MTVGAEGIGIVVCGDPWTGGVIGLSAQSSSAAMPEEQGATDHVRNLGLKLKKVLKKRKKGFITGLIE